MRSLFAGLLLSVVLAAPALADPYNVTISNFNMPTPSPAGSAAKCRPYLGATAIAGAERNCGQAAALSFTVPAEGAYAVTYSTVTALGLESAGKSPGLSFVVDKVPPTPTTPPTGTVTCDPSPCPAGVKITVTLP